MATGDDATAAGMDVVPGTTLANTIDTEITKSRDYIANGHTYWKPGLSAIPISKGGCGATTAAGARTALGLQTTVDRVAAATGATPTNGVLVQYESGGRINVGDPTGSGNAANKGYVDSGLSQKVEIDVFGEVKAGFLDNDVYNRDITTTRRAVWVSSGGTLGYASSKRAKKQNIEPAELTLEQLLAIPVVTYRYRKAVAAERAGKGRAAVEIGSIADDLHALGLWHFVIYEKGEPVGIHYEILSLAALSLGQQLAGRLVQLEARVEALENG